MALITRKELIEEVYRRIAQDVDVAQTEYAETDDNPTYPLEVVAGYLWAAECNFRSRLFGHTSLWRGYAEIDVATGTVELPEDFLSDLQLTYWADDNTPEHVIERVEEEWLDEHRATWRSQTVEKPRQYIIKQTETGGMDSQQRLGVYFVDQPTATVTDGARGPYTKRPTEMVADDDECVTMYAFPQIQRTVLPYDVLSMMMGYGGSQTADARGAYYAGLREKDMEVARRICAGLGRRTHTNATKRS